MPHKPPSVCSVSGCPRPAYDHGRCDLHAEALRRSIEANRPTAALRGYSSDWRKKRQAFLQTHPYCADPYQAHGASEVLATDVDHIIPRKEGGSDDESNLQSLCHMCHSRKTALEDGRWGRRRLR